MCSKDRFDTWQYKVFRMVVFIFFLATVFKLVSSL